MPQATQTDLPAQAAGDDPDAVTVEIDHGALRRLADAWPRRATVRAEITSLDDVHDYDPARPDYPAAMVPFWDHPGFSEAAPAQRQQVLTLAWLAYNDRVIDAEEHVANPA